MIYLKLIFSLLMPLYIGYLIVALILNNKEDSSLLERLALSCLIGTGTLSFSMFLISWAGIRLTFLNILLPFIIILIPIQVLAVKNGAFLINLPAIDLKRLSLLESSILLYVGFKVFYSLFEAIIKPVTAWDAFAHHLLKSKAFFLEQTISPDTLHYIGGGLGYPMNIPLNVSWIYICLGQWNDALCQAIFPLLFICAAGVFYFSLARYTSRLNSLIGIFILTSLPIVTFHSTISYTDLPVAIYNLAAVIFLFNYIKTANFKYVWIASLLSACALWTKNEALGYVVINAAVFSLPILIDNKDKLRSLVNIMGVYLSTSVLVFFAWNLYKALEGIVFAQALEGAGLINYFARVNPILSMFYRKLFIDGNWNIFWYLFSILLIFRIVIILRDSSKYLLILIFAYILFYFVYFLMSSAGIYAFVFNGTVLCRNFISFTFVAVFFLSLNFPIGQKKKL